jgi:hypothetical protein
MTIGAGNIIYAVDLAMVATSVTDNTARTTTSASFTSTLTAANICGVSFTAPPSGKVVIMWNVDQDNDGAGFVATSIAIRTGSTVGSGTSVLAAAFATSKIDYNGAQSRGATYHTQTGLTAGTVYNVYLEHLTSTGTGTFQWRAVTVLPQLA